ncbi:MAG: M23 family metallopeptidase [Hyphomicrobiaceae bacterium]
MRQTRALVPTATHRQAPTVFLARTNGALVDAYTGEPRRTSHHRFRWLLSTCLAAIVGAIAFGVVIYGFSDAPESRQGLLPSLREISSRSLRPAAPPKPAAGTMKWALAKQDRLQMASASQIVKHIIRDRIPHRRGTREYIQIKPYARIVGKLPTVPAAGADQIPPFNPFKLYPNPAPTKTSRRRDSDSEVSHVTTKVVELLGGFLPVEDGQTLDGEALLMVVSRAIEPTERARSLRPSFQPAGAPQLPEAVTPELAKAQPPNTTVLRKTSADADDDPEEGLQTQTVKSQRGDTLLAILRRSGIAGWQARQVVEVAKTVFPDSALTAGHEIRLGLVPSLSDSNLMEPVKIAIYDPAKQHRVTVQRTASGEYVARTTTTERSGASPAETELGQRASLYISLYQTALMQGVPHETVMQILRIHAYETDFRRRTRAGDSLELFFDLKDDEKGADSPPGELLYTAISTEGETRRYYRFRTPDGVVDYYDEQGQNARKFLLRKPVVGDIARLTSGYGVRMHPLLGQRRMHTGIDWAAPHGTPIMAAGAGIIEESGRKSGYGNYIRIRHANGYKTTYAHMQRIARGMDIGTRVRQRQIIGYVGSTGLSSGAHLHFEILVNNSFVDPLRIHVPKERKLAGKALADFQRERARIDELMRRTPDYTRVTQASATR